MPKHCTSSKKPKRFELYLTPKNSSATYDIKNWKKNYSVNLNSKVLSVLNGNYFNANVSMTLNIAKYKVVKIKNFKIKNLLFKNQDNVSLSDRTKELGHLYHISESSASSVSESICSVIP